MDYEISWTTPAVAELEAIIAFLQEHSAAATERITTGIVQRVEQLKSVPFLGTIYPTGSTNPVRKILFEKYRIFYRVVEEAKRVEILSIWHGSRRDPDLTD
jgi:toxin ParE1/3/4